MTDERLTVLNFTGLCRSLENGVIPGEACFIDLSDIPGTMSYCDDSAVSLIRERLTDNGVADCRGIHLTDNGNYHYMSRILTELGSSRYDLIVFDHHTDMMMSAFGDILSCGGWIRDSLINDINLERVICVGADKALIRETLEKDPAIKEYTDSGRVIFTDAASLRENIAGSDIPVYLSLDLDVLSDEELITNWDQGEMRIEELVSALNLIQSSRTIMGMDICGGPSAGSSGAFDESEITAFGEVLKELLKCLYCKKS